MRIVRLFAFSVAISLTSLDATLALVSCSPSSCTPACDSSCTYYTCSQEATHTIDIRVLSFSEHSEPSGACSHSNLTVFKLPFSIDDVSYHTLPARVTHKYKTCKAYVIHGEPCPP